MEKTLHPSVYNKKYSLYLLLSGVILLSFISLITDAQKQGKEYIDSVKQELLKHSEDDTVKVIMLYSIAFELHSSSPIKSIEYGEKALVIAERLGYTGGIILSLLCTGNGYWELSDYPKALDFFFRALKISEQANKNEY